MNTDSHVSVSVVSHGQIELVEILLRDLAAHVKTPIEFLLTVNVPETPPMGLSQFAFPTRVLCNAEPRGFGANHNAAFRESRSEFFCVMNPDIRIEHDPFPALLACLQDWRAGVVAPLIRSPSGAIEDSARHFPTPWTILRKTVHASPKVEYPVRGNPVYPDWVAGMFMLFPREVFAEIGGFDEKYFLYYEDVDLCARLTSRGRRVVLCPAATVVHEARRQSRHSFRYLRWHLVSMVRFFLSRPAQLSPARKVKKVK